VRKLIAGPTVFGKQLGLGLIETFARGRPTATIIMRHAQRHGGESFRSG
jgi:hypothetical protein